jgi:hypothetical protein
LAGAALAPPGAALAQTPKRGGTLTVRVWDPPHFDPYSRLLKHKAGPSVPPGSFVLEGDLAESWSQSDDWPARGAVPRRRPNFSRRGADTIENWLFVEVSG